MNSILLYSGGLDSTTILYDYKDVIKLCLYIDYGNANKSKELEQVYYHAGKLNKEVKVLDAISLFKGITEGKSISLFQDYKNHTENYVLHFRNGIFVSIAISFAALHNYDNIYTGFCCSDDESASCIIDTTHQFVSCMTDANDNKISILSPYCLLPKSAVLLKAESFGIELSKTWSCFGDGPERCGECNACLSIQNAILLNYEK